MRVNVEYKSIFKYIDHKETFKCNGVGEIKRDKVTKISFNDNDQIIQIELHEDHVILKHNQSKLKLIKDRKVLNYYQTDYGILELTCKLEMIDTSNGIKMKYLIYDNNQILSEVYVLLKYQELDDETNKEIIN